LWAVAFSTLATIVLQEMSGRVPRLPHLPRRDSGGLVPSWSSADVAEAMQVV
jgi:hypothetical protein